MVAQRYIFHVCHFIMAVVMLACVTSCHKDDADCGDPSEMPQDSVPKPEEKKKTENGLPIIMITTPDGRAIQSKETYIEGATVTVINEDSTEAFSAKTKIRGRGNTSWLLMPKKSYKLKLEKAHSFFGEAEDKEWVLIANYCDKAMIRNALALYMGQQSTLDYTSSFHFVDLELNGIPQGTYMLAEQIKAAQHRVDVGDDGYLVVVESHSSNDEVTFKVSNLPVDVTLKSPKVKADSEEAKYAQAFMQHASEVLFSNKFLDPDDGYKKYIDMDSFAEWYVINEIARNMDAVMYGSCYMHFRKDGKLTMGPIWDFDIAFGNVNYNDGWKTDGFWVKRSNFMGRLFKDPAFVQKVKERMNYYHSNKQLYIDFIDSMANAIYKSQEANEQIWHTMNEDIWPCYTVYGSYEAEVNHLKEWLDKRMDWLQKEIQEMK